MQTNDVRTRLIGGSSTVQGSLLATNYRLMLLADPEDIVCIAQRSLACFPSVAADDCLRMVTTAALAR